MPTADTAQAGSGVSVSVGVADPGRVGVVFFFQAEDGIRDVAVTGVQTCALPISAGIALGHRRLSIIDLSPLGHQPMTSADSRYVITYNGEVYNFVELRAELEALGHRFRGGSDTEVMLAAFVAWGVEKAVTRFFGMFAIGLWDRQTRTLHLIRDRIGVKPLYWCRHRGVLLFGSE